MIPNTTSKKLRALPAQVIEINGGVILKRGCTEVKIVGDDVANGMRVILGATTDVGATREDIYKLFDDSARLVLDQILTKLVSSRLLVTEDEITLTQKDSENALDIFYWHFNDTSLQVLESLNKCPLIVLGVNFISRQLAAALVSSGWTSFQVVDDPQLRNSEFFSKGELRSDAWPARLTCPLGLTDWEKRNHDNEMRCLIATSDCGDRNLLRKWNRFCFDKRSHFLPVMLRNMIGYVGPLVLPGETACFECLQARQNAHIDDPDSHHAVGRTVVDGQNIHGFHPSMASILGDLAAIELTKFYSNAMPVWNVGKLLMVNLLATRMTVHKVLKIPRCATCSPLNVQPSTITTKGALGPFNRLNNDDAQAPAKSAI